MDTIIHYLPGIILVVIVFLILLFFFPLAYFLCLVLPFIMAREGYRMFMRHMHEKGMTHKLPYVGLLIFLIFIACWFLATRF